MLDTVNFIINSIIKFIQSLKNVIIPQINVSLYAYYISIIAISIIVSFVVQFLKMKRQDVIREKRYNKRQYKKALRNSYRENYKKTYGR
jgi:uncharacterized membrane protein (DUF106 family)